MLLESIIAIAKESAMTATLHQEIIEQAGQHAAKLWNAHEHNTASKENAKTWARHVGREFALEAAANLISAAAQNGARFIAPERPDLVQEAGQHAATIWHQHSFHNEARPIESIEDWAFTVGKNYARKKLNHQLAQQARLVYMSDPQLSKGDTLSCVDPTIERLSSGVPWITAPRAIQAIQNLASITIDTINRNSDHIDIRIFHSHYGRHQTFAVISRDLGISEDAAKKRWWRMINRTSDDVREIVAADPVLARIFDAILSDQDEDEFRKVLMNLMGFISERGLSSIEEAAHQMFPPA